MAPRIRILAQEVHAVRLSFVLAVGGALLLLLSTDTSAHPAPCHWPHAKLTDPYRLLMAGTSVLAVPDVVDQHTPCYRPVVFAHWAAITDQRRDVLDLTLEETLSILRGDIANWSQVGGTTQPISVYLPNSQAVDIASAVGLSQADIAATVLPDNGLIELVAATPGAFALVPSDSIRLGVLALTVDGHDPYRDPARDSPLRLIRWVRAPDAQRGYDLLAAAGIRIGPPFDPAGLLITGEILPVRCTDHVLDAIDDYDAMFNGVRRLTLAADLAIAPLELPLTDLGEPTPCVETVIFTGRPRRRRRDGQRWHRRCSDHRQPYEGLLGRL